MDSKWESLRFGVYGLKTVLAAVREPEWQSVRVSMLGTSLETKHATLVAYLAASQHSEHAKICVTNYVNALRRGGLLK